MYRNDLCWNFRYFYCYRYNHTRGVNKGFGQIGSQCPAWTSTAVNYLYDGGVLLATFDANDNFIDMFVNGPQGRIASCCQNNSAYLYYYLTNQLGSSRVMMRGSMPNSTYPPKSFSIITTSHSARPSSRGGVTQLRILPLKSLQIRGSFVLRHSASFMMILR